MYRFFVVPVDGQALLGIPDKETLYVLTINYNMAGIHTQCEHTYNEIEDEHHYKQHRGNRQPNWGNINTTGIPKLNNRDKPMVTDNIKGKINYYIPGPKPRTYKRVSAEFLAAIT